MTKIPLFCSSLVIFLVLATSISPSHENQTFLECLKTNSNPSYPISSLVYSPNNSSFPSVLQAYIRNLRFNESTTSKPLFILTALHESHIQAAIICAKAQGFQMKIRSGGHDYEGLSYISDVPFFILDMFNFRSINVNIDDESAWVEVGATLGEVYYRIAEKSNVHGFPAGVCPTVGVGGHISGGGYGNMMRKYGLTVDNIVDAKLIDVQGRVLDRKSMGEDLFWAISGGGGASYGVLLSYKIKLIRVPPKVTVFRVPRFYDQNALELAYLWQRRADKWDDDMFMRMIIDVVNSTTRPMEKTIRVSFFTLFLGDSKQLVSFMNENFPELGLQQKDISEMTWVESVLYYTSFPIAPIDALLRTQPPSVTYLKRKSDYLKKPMSKEGLEYIFKKMIELQTPTILTFNPYGGKMSEISPSAKPFPHRAGNIAKIQYSTNWNEGGVEAANHYLNLTRVLYNYMTPFVSKYPRAAFFNYRDIDLGVTHNGKLSYLEGQVYGIKYFLGNFNRLVKIKTKVDPDNFFRNEQSIPVYPWRK
ncbi:PREDICTED: berberine bridge enzyme-like 8 [Nicotiana attenuata]|uniref:Reticuline oxidase-like protein n=1 Tax=Nicotiana attenuata TaxID=49451 RepID=A0A1J6J5E8_NICAT|nr:PREDICTED: berberine bridge enzyme-like 8 [Nicotiana attenuata]OIT06115.1 reticuline oxidase-like protein [Nicotiana attenuata]